jgi:hypothetical protein
MAITTAAPTGCILTHTGKFVNPLEATVDDIDLADIAHSLSNLCRYNGHVSHFYSVAQHSVIVAEQFNIFTEKYLRKWGLLHDASEAYLGDVVAPLKHSGHYDFYLEAEDRMMEVICERFDLDLPMPEEIDIVDKMLRGPEMRDLKNYVPSDGNGGLTKKMYSFKIKPWLPDTSKHQFLHQAKLLRIE